MEKESIVFVGAGGFAKEIYYWLLPFLKPNQSIKGFLSNNPKDLAGNPDLPPHLGDITDYIPTETDRFILAIGSVAAKERVAYNLISRGAKFTTFIHGQSSIAPTAKIGEGCIIGPFTVISNNAVIGNFVTINSSCNIGHDSKIEELAILSPMSGIMGGSIVEKGAFLGVNSAVGPKVKIGQYSVTSAGCTVLKDLPANHLASPTFSKILKWK